MRGEVLVGDGLWRRVEVLGPFDGEWPELVSAAGLVEVVLGALGSLMLVVPVPVFKVHLTEYRFVDGLAQMTRSSRLGQRLTYRRARRLRRTALHQSEGGGS